MRLARALAAVMALGVAAPAQADRLPVGRVSLTAGAKHGTGALATSLGFGYAYGLEAGYAATTPAQRIGWGGSWSIVWSDYGADSARVSPTMKVVELDLALRVRVALGTGRQVLFLGGGGALVRTNEPLFDGGDRSHVGPMGLAGIEGSIRGFLVAATLRYGVVRDGQGTLGLQLSVGRGM